MAGKDIKVMKINIQENINCQEKKTKNHVKVHHVCENDTIYKLKQKLIEWTPKESTLSFHFIILG